MMEDTITAISTPLGMGGIGIVRLSGKSSFNIVKKIFKKSGKAREPGELPLRKMLHGYIEEPGTGKVIDEVLVCFMPAPHTYTREDVVEVNCHGGILPVGKILELTIRGGARLAQEGEFTKRAFLHGRIDLSQAEAVMDIIKARTEPARESALEQIKGRLAREINELRGEIVDLLTVIEVNIDFPEEGVDEVDLQQVETGIKKAEGKVAGLLKDAGEGRIYREGIKTVIAGKPNVGKSSLLNYMLREQRAIVTEIPGTTRDLLEETLNLKGVPLVLVDTAGIRPTGDLVEKIGVDKAEKIINAGDLILFILDATTGMEKTDMEIFELVKNKNFLIILNKTDLVSQERIKEIEKELVGYTLHPVSLKKEEGLEKLEEKIIEKIFLGRIMPPETALVTKQRHINSLEGAREHLRGAREALEGKVPLDLVAIDLQQAWDSLGEITGETLGEEVIEKIFSEFCVGK